MRIYNLALFCFVSIVPATWCSGEVEDNDPRLVKCRDRVQEFVQSIHKIETRKDAQEFISDWDEKINGPQSCLPELDKIAIALVKDSINLLKMAAEDGPCDKVTRERLIYTADQLGLSQVIHKLLKNR